MPAHHIHRKISNLPVLVCPLLIKFDNLNILMQVSVENELYSDMECSAITQVCFVCDCESYQVYVRCLLQIFPDAATNGCNITTGLPVCFLGESSHKVLHVILSVPWKGVLSIIYWLVCECKMSNGDKDLVMEY